MEFWCFMESYPPFKTFRLSAECMLPMVEYLSSCLYFGVGELIKKLRIYMTGWEQLSVLLAFPSCYGHREIRKSHVSNHMAFSTLLPLAESAHPLYLESSFRYAARPMRKENPISLSMTIRILSGSILPLAGPDCIPHAE